MKADPIGSVIRADMTEEQQATVERLLENGTAPVIRARRGEDCTIVVNRDGDKTQYVVKPDGSIPSDLAPTKEETIIPPILFDPNADPGEKGRQLHDLCLHLAAMEGYDVQALAHRMALGVEQAARIAAELFLIEAEAAGLEWVEGEYVELAHVLMDRLPDEEKQKSSGRARQQAAWARRAVPILLKADVTPGEISSIAASGRASNTVLSEGSSAVIKTHEDGTLSEEEKGQQYRQILEDMQDLSGEKLRIKYRSSARTPSIPTEMRPGEDCTWIVMAVPKKLVGPVFESRMHGAIEHVQGLLPIVTPGMVLGKSKEDLLRIVVLSNPLRWSVSGILENARGPVGLDYIMNALDSPAPRIQEALQVLVRYGLVETVEGSERLWKKP